MHIGVVIGRFQVAHLSTGHKYLIDQALAQHRIVLVLIGSSQEWGTVKNPLPYALRAGAVQNEYFHMPGRVIVLPLPDFPGNDKRWSHHVDVTIKSVGFPVETATLFAGRDSFMAHYVGEFKVVECDGGLDHVAGSEVRAAIGKELRNSDDFRAGLIYASQNPWVPPQLHPPKIEDAPHVHTFEPVNARGTLQRCRCGSVVDERSDTEAAQDAGYINAEHADRFK